jgi:hypothetical protein
MTSLRSRLSWLAVYAVAMAYVESAVVVYLRAIYYPDGFAFPLVLIEPGMSAIEIGREAATLVVLLGVAAVMTTDRWERFLFVALSFGIWDIFYYVWLWVFLGWPPSLFTWDILFLVPVPWIAPVLAPVIVSVGLIVGSLLLLRAKQHGARLAFPVWLWGLAVAGGVPRASLIYARFRHRAVTERPATVPLVALCGRDRLRRSSPGTRPIQGSVNLRADLAQ